MPAGIHIEPASAGQEEAALRLVFADLEPGDREDRVALILAEQGNAGPPDGLLVAREGENLVGAVFWQILPGNVGTLAPPRVKDTPRSAVAGELLQTARDQLARREVCMIQCLLRRENKSDLELLQQAGFEHFGDLYYLVSVAADFPQSSPSAELTFECYAPNAHASFAALVEATYEGTLDCPKMNGLRTTDDVLAGYRGSGEFDPSRWLVVRRAGRAIGCLLLADYPDQDNYELVYMGVVPQARGHGWGKQIAQYAQWRASQAGRQRLVVAADAANAPALRMYSDVGFRVWDRRSIVVWINARPN
jgi:ribosomal protein S18 acetylase RimI-like enzyme